MKNYINLDICKINEFVQYDERSPSGLIWIKKPSKRTNIGSIAGSLAKDGYWKLMLNKVHYSSHRIIYTILKNDIAIEMDIDHIDGNRANNNINNLRVVSHSENQRNMKRRTANKENIAGVYFDNSLNRWRATWRSLDNKWMSKSFSVSKHKELAESMAINARKEAIFKLNSLNAGYTFRHTNF